MNWRKIARPLRGAVVCAAALMLVGCRNLNPDFLGDMHGQTLPDEDSTSAPAGSTGANAELSTELGGKEKSSSETSSTSESADETSSELSSSTAIGTSSSEENTTEPAPKDLFCGSGVELCYPVYESDGSVWQSEDLGPEGNPLRLVKPSGWEEGVYKTGLSQLETSLWCKRPGYATSERSLSFQGSSLGIDLWIAPDGWKSNEVWAFVEIDNVLAIRRRSDGKLECQANLSTGKASAVLDVGKPSVGMHHVQCSFHEGWLELGFDASKPARVKVNAKAKLPEIDASLSVCQGQSLFANDPMLRGRVATLRVWSEIERMKATTQKERAQACSVLPTC